MNNKCEWKDDVFKECEKHNNYKELLAANSKYIVQSREFDFCPFCGSDIRNPEPEKPLIVKSGNTWVAHYQGVDYLNIRPSKRIHDMEELFLLDIKMKCYTTWKPFSEIELTDEIALLRPMVVHSASNTLIKLYGVRGTDCAVLLNDRMANCVKDFMILATAKELNNES